MVDGASICQLLRVSQEALELVFAAGGDFLGSQEETKMQVQQNRTPFWSSMDSHPSDKNKGVRWMGHGFIDCGLAGALLLIRQEKSDIVSHSDSI
jgi:hypothetical protein